MADLKIGPILIPEHELVFKAIRAQGSGGQNVNKVSSAVHLRFNLHDSSLADGFKHKILRLNDHHITASGEIIIKAQESRSLEDNKTTAIERLSKIIERALIVEKKRRATKPTLGSQKRRMDKKKARAQTKKMRGKIDY